MGEGPGGTAAEAERAGEPRWHFDCPHPFGGTRTATASGNTDSSWAAAAIAAAEAKADLPLRTRVRFEMAPGVAVPRGIGSLSGPLEFRALRAFAAGGAGPPGTREVRHDGGVNEGLCRRRRRRRRQQQRQRVLGSGRGGAEDGPGAAQGESSSAAAAAEATESRRRQEGDEAMEMWRKAALYWQHPATPLPQEALAAQKAAQARVTKNPTFATKAQDSGSRPGGSAASGYVAPTRRICLCDSPSPPIPFYSGCRGLWRCSSQEPKPSVSPKAKI